jgi:hypothetical protein
VNTTIADLIKTVTVGDILVAFGLIVAAQIVVAVLVVAWQERRYFIEGWKRFFRDGLL